MPERMKINDPLNGLVFVGFEFSHEWDKKAGEHTNQIQPGLLPSCTPCDDPNPLPQQTKQTPKS